MTLEEFKYELLRLTNYKGAFPYASKISKEQHKIILEALNHGLSIDEIASYSLGNLPQLIRLKIRDNISEIEG